MDINHFVRMIIDTVHEIIDDVKFENVVSVSVTGTGITVWSLRTPLILILVMIFLW